MLCDILFKICLNMSRNVICLETSSFLTIQDPNNFLLDECIACVPAKRGTSTFSFKREVELLHSLSSNLPTKYHQKEQYSAEQ